MVEINVGGAYPFLDGTIEPLYIWDVLTLGYVVDTNILYV